MNTDILAYIKYAQINAKCTFTSNIDYLSINLSKGDKFNIVLANDAFIDVKEHKWYITTTNDKGELYLFTINQLKEFFDIEGPKSKFVLDKEYASNVLKELTPLLGREYKVKQGEEEIALVKDDVLTLLYCFDGTPSLPERIINGKNFYVALKSKSYGPIVGLNYELINHYLELQK